MLTMVRARATKVAYSTNNYDDDESTCWQVRWNFTCVSVLVSFANGGLALGNVYV